ncbi:MAG: metallophosphoesterase [Planctomycetota bacterium]
MNDAGQAIAMYQEAAEHNRQDPLLSGSVLNFPPYGQVVMTGDLHGHRRNFTKLQRFCDLEHLGARHVVLHELIHEEPVLLNGPDLSHQLLLDAAKWKCEFPDQVHFLLSNHELAQILNNEITKNGRVVTKDFENSVFAEHGSRGDEVLSALYDFIRSFPLAGRTRNRVWLSHSLPAPRDLPYFDNGVLTRSLTQSDLDDCGSAHMMVWGRYHTDGVLASLRELLDVDYFICGHQPQETGYDVLHSRMIILASDHNHGVFLPIDLNKPVELDALVHNIRPFAAIE